jgi:GT2 family glycosyltransferase
MTCRIAISIINYRTADLTLNCIQSVLAEMSDHDAQIVVVDNASGDGSAEEIADWIKAQPDGTPVTLVRSDKNTGFSGGHNLGLTAVEAQFYLVLNSDAILRPGFLTAILKAADENPKAGLIAPQIETEDGDIQVSCFRFHSPISELMRGAQTGPVTRMFQHRVIALDPPVQPEQIEWASFACILLRQDMISQIGLMDDGYFLYFEDAEYCLRARRAGWGIVQETSAVAVHYRGGSGPVKTLEKARKRLPAYFYASRTRFFRQAHGATGPLAANLLWLIGRTIAQLRRIVGKSVPPASDAEVRDIWTNVLTPLGPRRAPGE